MSAERPAALPAVEVDGLTVLRAPAVDGRSAGGLVFRVGHADEALTQAGLTHLTEHLALHFSDPTKLHSNGMTGPNLTHFHSSGRLEDVVDFLNRVAAALRSLPLDRLDTEKSVLRAEAARRQRGTDPIHTWRYGAQGYGIASYAELGLHGAGPEDVAAWAARWFTTGNAVAWLVADEMPSGLDLRLAPGERVPAPPVRSILAPGPASYPGPDGVVLGSTLVARSSASRIYASVLEQALYRELRQIGGYSYSPAATYDPLTGDTATIYAVADALPENQGAVVGGLVDVLARLRLGAIDEADIAAAVLNVRQQLDHPDVRSLRLPSDAGDLLLGHRSASEEELHAELDAVDAEAVRAVAEQAHRSMLLQVPEGRVDWADYASAPEWNGQSYDGVTAAFVRQPGAGITAGPGGLSLRSEDETTGFAWGELAAVLAYPDGARTLVGRDGFQVHVEPNVLGREVAQVLATIAQRVDPALVVAMPARHRDRIPPVPDPKAEKRAARARTGRWGRGGRG